MAFIYHVLTIEFLDTVVFFMTVDIINDYTDNYFLSVHQVFCNFLNSGEYSMFECVCLCVGYVCVVYSR